MWCVASQRSAKRHGCTLNITVTSHAEIVVFWMWACLPIYTVIGLSPSPLVKTLVLTMGPLLSMAPERCAHVVSTVIYCFLGGSMIRSPISSW